MKLTTKTILLSCLSSFIYIFIFRFSFIKYVILELVTVGMYLGLLTFYEALTIKNCKLDYDLYLKRQKEALNRY